jgi:hypothetical protein
MGGAEQPEKRFARVDNPEPLLPATGTAIIPSCHEPADCRN